MRETTSTTHTYTHTHTHTLNEIIQKRVAERFFVGGAATAGIGAESKE
jgi:hypothetical protein